MLKYSDHSPSIYKVQWIHVCFYDPQKEQWQNAICHGPSRMRYAIREIQRGRNQFRPRTGKWWEVVREVHGGFQLLESCNLSQYLGAIWVSNFLQCWNIELDTHVHTYIYIYIRFFKCLVPPPIARTFEFSFTGDRTLLLQSQNQLHK